jgi:hypothetical protein
MTSWCDKELWDERLSAALHISQSRLSIAKAQSCIEACSKKILSSTLDESTSSNVLMHHVLNMLRTSRAIGSFDLFVSSFVICYLFLVT